LPIRFNLAYIIQAQVSFNNRSVDLKESAGMGIPLSYAASSNWRKRTPSQPPSSAWVCYTGVIAWKGGHPMGRVKQISFEEFAAHLAEIMNQVRTEHTSVQVVFAGGEKVMIKPASPAPRGPRKAQHKAAAPLADERPPQPPPHQAPEDASATGAMYELDPKSITPG
jgi:hypothetical protein